MKKPTLIERMGIIEGNSITNKANATETQKPLTERKVSAQVHTIEDTPVTGPLPPPLPSPEYVVIPKVSENWDDEIPDWAWE